MKRLSLNFNSFFVFLIAAAFVLGSLGCENDPKNPGSTTDPVKNNPSNQNPPKEITGRMKYVVGQIWWYEAYVSDNTEYCKDQRGKWFQFNADGSFVYGKYQDQIDSGTWSYDEPKETLYLSNPGGSETLEWKTMMSHTNDQMVFLGPPRGQNGGDQTMLRPYLQKPRPQDIPNWRCN
jgi:hypothetical protein